jgi:hypothetical protein
MATRFTFDGSLADGSRLVDHMVKLFGPPGNEEYGTDSSMLLEFNTPDAVVTLWSKRTDTGWRFGVNAEISPTGETSLVELETVGVERG